MKIPFVLYVLFVCVCVVFTACGPKTVPAASVPSPASNAPDTVNMQQNILYHINQYRQCIGLPALQLVGVASAVATRHSANMASGQTPFGHAGFEGRVTAIARSLGPVSAAAENVAEGKMGAKQVVDGWLHSPAHKKNIEGKYALTGIGYAMDKQGIIYFTQIFVLK